MTARREMTIVVVAAAVGAALMLLAASQTWLTEVEVRPAPLPSATIERTGGSLVPLLPALGLVTLAGAGALLATRGVARTVVAGLLAGAGLAGVTVAGIALGRAGITIGWVLPALLGSLLAAAAGVVAVLRHRAWPKMGARYERPNAGAATTYGSNRRPDGSTEPDQVVSGSEASLWDALDRGEDPTKS